MALIVEDDPNWLLLFKKKVQESKQNFFEFDHAPDLKTALVLLEKNDYQLVLLDLILPDSFGENTIKAIMSKVKYIPVLVISTLGDEKIIADAMKLGVEDYLVKDEYEDTVFFHIVQRGIRRTLAKMSTAIKDDMDGLMAKLKGIDKKLDIIQSGYTKGLATCDEATS